MTKLKQQIELSLNKELCRHAFHAGVTSEGTNKKELFEDWWCEKMIELNNTEDANKLNIRSAVKPPLGIIPKHMWEIYNKVHRINDVSGAIARYYDAGLKIKIEWIEEYNELIESVCNDKYYQEWMGCPSN